MGGTWLRPATRLVAACGPLPRGLFVCDAAPVLVPARGRVAGGRWTERMCSLLDREGAVVKVWVAQEEGDGQAFGF